MKFRGRGGFVGLAFYIFPFADGGKYGKEGAQTTPLHVEEPAEQVLDLIYRGIMPTLHIPF